METKPEQNHNIHIRTVKTAKTIVAFFFLIAAPRFRQKIYSSKFHTIFYIHKTQCNLFQYFYTCIV